MTMSEEQWNYKNIPSNINDVNEAELEKKQEEKEKTKEKTTEEKTNFNVFHKDKRGINVIIETEDSKSLSYKLRQEFLLDSHGMITKCPNYNRLKEKAIAIEIKNLHIPCLKRDNLDEIIGILKKYD